MSDTFEIQLKRLDGYRFEADFGIPEIPALVVDEPPPLGENEGPNPARLLALAVGNCLSASLLFCLSKSRVEVNGVEASVTGTYVRNENGRLRIGGLDVSISIDAPCEAGKLQRCLEMFEDFCVVTASVRRGLPVTVTVCDAGGSELYRSATEPSPA